MCAIVGATGKNEQAVRESLRLVGYRGPDASDTYMDEQVTLGHNRLAIIDLDPRSNQPFFDPEGNVGLVYNGEIYNYQKLRDELRKEGVAFRTESDTEVLLHAYKQWGRGFVERLEGMFAFALYDKQKGKVCLYTDHESIKPLFYAQVEDILLFGSELKTVLSLRRSLSKEPEIDSEALDTYFALGYVPAPRTLFAGVRKLAPATWGEYDLENKELTVSAYNPFASVKALPVQDAVDHAVRSHLIADVPVGLFFSGGTDSSLLAAVLKAHGISLTAFCVEIADRPEDAQYAGEVAKLLGLSYEHLPFGVPEFDAIYDEVVNRIDEPFADSSLFPTYYVSKKAREKVTVVLSGEGGDEFFFGYPRSRDLFSMRTAHLDASVGMLERIFFLLPAFRGKNKLFEHLYVWLRKPIAFYLLTMSPSKSLISFAQWCIAKKAIAQTVTAPSALDAELYLPNNLLRKADLATMYASVEGRVPLLDKQVIAAAKEAAPSLRDLAVLKPALKQLLAQYLPEAVVYRKKTGFGLRTKSYLGTSVKLKRDLTEAVAYLKQKSLLRIRIPNEAELAARYPNVCWQLVFLYHALKNAGV